jgi:hypothetical protein
MLTYGQARIAAWSAALGIVTMLAAIAAAIYARGATRIAERALKDGQRAFIFPERIEENGLRDKQTGEMKAWQFRFPWRNTGTTAAMRCEAHVNVLYWLRDDDRRAKGLPPPEPPAWWPFPDGNQQRVRFALGPNAARSSGPITVPIDQLRNAAIGDARIYFYGWIKYSDVFGGRRETRFCVELAGFSGDPAGPQVPSLSYHHWKTFNCADGECEREDREAYAVMPPHIEAEFRKQGWEPRFEGA